MGRNRKRAWLACSLLLAPHWLGASAAMAQDAPPPPDDDKQEIIVTGSRIPRPSLDNPSPTQSVEPEQFVLTGVANVEQTLNQLPQLVPSFTTTSNNPGTGAATLNLRGLGSVRTLILVNGRRWIASDAGEVPEVDVNTIPAALLERVDIVTGGASAVYGSDAVTGVINFVLKDKLDGFHLDARQGISARGDARVSSADMSFGTGFLGDRGNLLVSGGWLDQAPVTQAERRFTIRSLADGCAVPGTRTEFGDSTPLPVPVSSCAPPNEVALIAGGSPNIPGSRLTGAPAFFPIPGGTALSRNPFGVRFDPDGTPRPFIMATDLYNFAPGNYLQVGFERLSANLLASIEIAPAFTPYAELSWIETRSPQQLAPVPATLGRGSQIVPVARVNLDNPFLTVEAARLLDLNYGTDAEGDRGFIGSIAAGFRLNPAYGGDADGIVQIPQLQSRLEGLGPRQRRNRREAMRGLFGLRGELTADWSYDAYHSRSRVEHVVDLANSGSARRLQQAILARRDPATGQIVCIDPSNNCVPANIFGAGNLSAAAADFIRTGPNDLTIVEEQVGEASARGELPMLAAGPAGVVLGATWRRNAYRFAPDAALFTGDDLGFLPGVPAAGSTEVWELFAEARVPLVADRPFVRELTAELGLRYSDYDSVGGVWTWKALGEWVPVAGLRARGGYQRAVRAPNVRELFAQPTFRGTLFLDPCAAASGLLGDPAVAAACRRDGVPADAAGGLFFEAFAETQTRGDTDLDAEVARTLTLGAVASPLPGLSVTLDYYDIRIRRAIGTFGGGGVFLVAGCIAGGADPADPLCAAYDREPDGTILFIDQPTANLPEVRARGLDGQLAWRRRLGLSAGDRIDLNLSGTYYFENSFRPNAGVRPFDCAGLFGFPCGNTIGGTATPKWKLFNQLAYTAGPATLTLRHRWFSPTVDARNTLRDALGFAPIRLPEEGRRLEGRHYLDLPPHCGPATDSNSPSASTTSPTASRRSPATTRSRRTPIHRSTMSSAAASSSPFPRAFFESGDITRDHATMALTFRASCGACRGRGPCWARLRGAGRGGGRCPDRLRPRRRGRGGSGPCPASRPSACPTGGSRPD
jgi:iron complex outermembrane recepter protein